MGHRNFGPSEQWHGTILNVATSWTAMKFGTDGRIHVPHRMNDNHCGCQFSCSTSNLYQVPAEVMTLPFVFSAI